MLKLDYDLSTLNKDPCILSKSVLDSSFSLGAHQSFQISTIVSDYPFGIFKLFLTLSDTEILVTRQDKFWTHHLCLGFTKCLLTDINKKCNSGTLDFLLQIHHFFYYKDLCDSHGLDDAIMINGNSTFCSGTNLNIFTAVAC